MKKGWQTKTLEEVCKFSNGLWKGEKPPFVNVGVIRNTNFTKEGTLDDSEIAYLSVEAKKLEKRHLKFGDIILEKSGGGPKQPVGRVAVFDKEVGDFSFSNFTAALRVLDPNELDFRYLHKFLHWTYLSGVTEGMQSHSTGIRNLNGDAYKAIKFSFPPLPEQQRIVGILDEAFAGIATVKANAEENLQNARALFESHLQSVFTQRGPGWVEKTIGEVSEVIAGQSPEGKFYNQEGNGLPFYQGKKEFMEKYIGPPTTWTTSITKEARQGDILMSVRAPVGPVNISTERICIGRGLSAIRATKGVDKDFLFHFLVKHESEIVGNTGAVFNSINKTQIENLAIPIPPLSEQQRIVTQLNELSIETQRLASLYERKLAALEALKKSLLHQAFTGEL